METYSADPNFRTSHSSEETRQSEVIRLVTESKTLLGDLLKAIDELEGRLGPVLRGQEPTSGESSEKPVLVPLAYLIFENNIVLSYCLDRINGLRKRLEI